MWDYDEAFPREDDPSLMLVVEAWYREQEEIEANEERMDGHVEEEEELLERRREERRYEEEIARMEEEDDGIIPF